MSEPIRVKADELIRSVREALAEAGMNEEGRRIEAELMVEADLQGVPSHGVKMLPGLLRGIRDGVVKPNPKLTFTKKRPATCMLDGDNGPGRFVSFQAMRHAIERARQFGIGACLATRLSHWGRAHAYANVAAQSGMIGVCMTNAIPNMVAWGSSKPLLANNPLAIGVPGAGGEQPIILDIAMSQAAVGKIRTFQREGKKTPQNWGLDAEGRATDDPAAILSSGRILPFGEHKGAGLALMIELLTGALAGELLSHEMVRSDKSGLDANSSKLFIALDVEALTDREHLGNRIKDLIAWLRESEPALAITLPGQRGWETKQRYLAEGIPLHAQIVDELRVAGVVLRQ